LFPSDFEVGHLCQEFGSLSRGSSRRLTYHLSHDDSSHLFPFMAIIVSSHSRASISLSLLTI
jgi:hypothetical protein